MERATPLAHKVLVEPLMTTALRSVARALGSFGNALRWSLSAVEDAPQVHLVPMPGPAHGPVPAIDLLPQARRRRATRA